MFWGWKLSWSSLRRQWLQSLLMLLGLALGTAVVVAVDLANQSASHSFEMGQQALSGLTTHRIIAPGGGFVPEAVFRQLRKAGLVASTPLITARVQVRQWQNRPLRLMGIDPLSETPFRSHLGATPGNPDRFASFLSRNDTVLLPANLKSQLPANRRLDLQNAGQTTQVEVIGLLELPDPLLQASLDETIFCDIGTAQRILGRPGQLSEIDLILPQELKLTQQIQNLLPPGLKLVSAHAQSDALQQMSHAFQLNLSAMSLLALIVGMFLVYNTVSFSVLRRRSQLGTLRSLGVTRAEVWTLIVGETLLLGLLGSLIGIFLGIGLGQGLLKLVVRTINDLYYTLEVTQLTINPISLLKGVGGALSAALLATVLPAWEATRTPPAGVMRASSLEDRLQPQLGLLAGLGLISILLGGGLTLLPSPIWFSFACFVMVVAGTALCIPWLAHAVMEKLANRLGPVLRMAPRNLARSLSRTAVAMAALMVAVSVVISVSIMIGSFRETLIHWLDQTLSSDLFVIQVEGQPLPARLVDEMRQQAGVKQVESSRQLQVLTDQGLIHLMAASRHFSPHRRFVWLDGPPDSLWQRLEAGGVLVSQPFASHHGIRARAGQLLTLPGAKGSRNFRILGIYYDYASDQGVVMIPSAVYQRDWQDTSLTSLAIVAQPGEDLQKLKARLIQRFGGLYQLDIQSQREIKNSALTIFERTFAITGALRLLAVIVAVIGIFSTLLALLLERKRSFGILRALGMSPAQLGSLILFESGLMGLFAGLMSMPLGVILALFLIYVINLRSFGWTMDLSLHPWPFVQGLLLAIAAALVAGIWPAWRAASGKITRSIRWE